MPAIALIPTDLQFTCFGLAARLDDQLAGRSILEHTLRRITRIESIEKLVLVCPQDQADALKDHITPLLSESPHAAPEEPRDEGAGILPSPLTPNPKPQTPHPSSLTPLPKPIEIFPDTQTPTDAHTPRWLAARKWALNCWRGGLGDATVYDELMPWGALVRALQTHGIGETKSALLARCDWCLIDPHISQQVLTRHLEHRDGMKITFSQAPPGLAGIATRLEILKHLDENGAAFGSILGYKPRRPSIDPISRGANITIPSSVRDCGHRFIYDTPRTIAMIHAMAQELSDDLLDADALQLARAAHALTNHPGDVSDAAQVTLELTPRRSVTGPITPHHHTTFDRPDLDLEVARRILHQLAEHASACQVPHFDPSPRGQSVPPPTPLLSEADGGASEGAGISAHSSPSPLTPHPSPLSSSPSDLVLLLGGLGDALLHPHWDEIVRIAKDAGFLGVGIETDLLCDRTTVEKLLDLPLDLVTVRLNADTAATYERVMGVDGFKTVGENLEWLINERNRRAHAAPPMKRRDLSRPHAAPERNEGAGPPPHPSPLPSPPRPTLDRPPHHQNP